MKIIETPEFTDWIDNLRDVVGQAIISARIDRLMAGNPGQVKSVGSGIFEFKVNVGPGYRVYFLRRGAELVILLAGGDKKSQNRDIKLAKKLADDFK
jgi:putative addiction module killer protein